MLWATCKMGQELACTRLWQLACVSHHGCMHVQQGSASRSCWALLMGFTDSAVSHHNPHAGDNVWYPSNRRLEESQDAITAPLRARGIPWMMTFGEAGAQHVLIGDGQQAAGLGGACAHGRPCVRRPSPR